MPATLVWGNGFRIERTMLPSGEEYSEVLGIDGGQEPISWASVVRMQEIAASHGVDPEMWPVYQECEDETEIPLADAEYRSVRILAALDKLDDDVIREDYWLTVVLRLLRGGSSFFIVP